MENKDFFGFNHTNEEVRGHVDAHVHIQKPKRGLLSWLSGGKETTYTAEYDGRGEQESTRSPLLHRDPPQTPSMPDGKYRQDRNGVWHRVR